MTTPFAWTGRCDPTEAGETRRLHQVVTHLDPLAPKATRGVTLLGFAVDEGVRRNQGRVGAAAAPEAIRRALANLAVHWETPLQDAGDISCEDGDLQVAQAHLGVRVANQIGCGALPLVVGGGHEVAWGTFQGVMASLRAGERLAVVNLDAHFDLRHDTQATSGTPFAQMAAFCQDAGLPFSYHVLGINQFANTHALFARAQRLGVRWWEDAALESVDAAAPALADLATVCTNHDAVYLSLDLDVLPASVAPGVSAPAAVGVPLPVVLAAVRTVVASGRLRAMDIAEYNPTYDVDGQTARVAARVVAEVLVGRGVD